MGGWAGQSRSVRAPSQAEALSSSAVLRLLFRFFDAVRDASDSVVVAMIATTIAQLILLPMIAQGALLVALLWPVTGLGLLVEAVALVAALVGLFSHSKALAGLCLAVQAGTVAWLVHVLFFVPVPRLL